MRDAFAEIAVGAPCVLLSRGNFERLDAVATALLRRVLNGHAVTVVDFARRWSGLLPSVWQESVKRGGAEILSAFALRHPLQPFRCDVLNYANVLDWYAAMFSADALRLASCDAVLEDGVPLPAEDAEIIRLPNAMARRERGRAPSRPWPWLLFHDWRMRAIPPLPRRAPLCAVPSRRCAFRTISPRSEPWSRR